MHCPRCGVNITSPGTDCPTCGASLRQSCPHCNFRNLIGQQFCGQCGADLAAAPDTVVVEESVAAAAPENKGALSHYPVLSVELMNFDQLAEKISNPDQLARVARDLMLRLERQLVSQGATVESIRDTVLFFSFRQEKSAGQALSKALKVAIALARKNISLQGVNLQSRVGIDFVAVNERGPMTAVPERMIAQSAQVVVSGSVYQMTHKQVPYETVGPIKVQEKMRTFYRIPLDTQPAGGVEATPTEVLTPSGMVDHRNVKAPDPEPFVRVLMPPLKNRIKLERKFEQPEQPKPVTYQQPAFVSQQEARRRPNVGYQQAIKSLQVDLEEMLNPDEEVKGKIIALCGDEGSGKSTIISMVRAQLPEDGLIWVGANFYEAFSGDGFPFHFWVELIQNLVGLPNEGIPREQAEEYLDTLLKARFGDSFPPERADFIKTILSIHPLEPITPNIREHLGRMIPEFFTLLSSMAQIKPVVMVVENLDFSDPASVELLLQLFQQDLMKSPICILLTYTPTLMFTGMLHQAVSLLPFKEYVLDGADEETLMSMAEPPLAVPWKKLPDTLRAQLIEKGSPMFLEEAFRWLHAEGGLAINAKTGKLTPEKQLKSLHVPEDLIQVVGERFLKQEELFQRVMQIASILGERFSTNILAHLLSRAGLTQAVEHFEDVLKFLWQGGFVVPDFGTMARFRHHLIWHVAYYSIDDVTRQRLHQLAIAFLEEERAKGMCLNPCWLANQHQQAGFLEQAVWAWNQAGAWLADVGSVTGANLAFQNMQQLMESGQMQQDPLNKKRLLESLGILNMDVNPEYSKNLLLSAMQIREQETLGEYIQLRLFLTQAYERMGAYHHATSTIHRALEMLPKEENAMERLVLGSQEVWFLYLQGNYHEALTVYDDEVRPYLTKLDRSPWEDPVLRYSYARGELALARIALWQCNPVAFDIIDEALTQCDVYGEQVMAIQFLLTRSMGLLMKGDFEGCQREMEPMLTDIERLPNPAEVMAWWGLIVLMFHCEMGDWENAMMLLPNTSYQAEQSRDYLAWCLCQALAGRISSATGQTGEAQKQLETAVTVAAEYQLCLPALMGWRYIAENELVLSNPEVAEQICQRAMDVAQKPNIQNIYEFYQLNITHAKIMIATNRLKEAGTMLEKYWPQLIKAGYTPLVAEAAFQISELYRYLGQEVPDPHRAKYREKQSSFLQKAIALWQEQGNSYRLAPYAKAHDGVSV